MGTQDGMAVLCFFMPIYGFGHEKTLMTCHYTKS